MREEVITTLRNLLGQTRAPQNSEEARLTLACHEALDAEVAKNEKAEEK